MSFQDEVKNIIDKTDIVSLVESYNITLEKQGKNYKGLCPFHNENTPSFIVSPEKKLATCFGCHGGGNPISFVMQIENVGYKEAVEILAKKNGITLSSFNNDKDYESELNKQYYDILNLSKDFYKGYLNNTKDGQRAIKYLIDRGLSQELIDEFNIGLAPNEFDTLYKVLKESNYLELDMYDCGLIDKNNNGYHDIFVNRIMFPIFDIKNRVIGYSARIFNDEKNQPKYINSRETALYHKNEVLFNINLAKSDIMKKRRVILHEGQMDVIASYKSGLKEAICTMGTAINQNQVNVLRKMTNNIIICYDGDKAGIEASKKAINLFEQNGFIVHLVLLPDNLDPDDFSKKYGNLEYYNYFNENIIDSKEYLYRINLLNKNLNDNQVIEEVKKNIFELLSNMNSETLVNTYLNRLKDDLNLDKDSLIKDYNNYISIIKTPKYNEIYNDYDIPDYTEYEEIKPEVIKPKWNSIVELRIFVYAKNRGYAMYINEGIKDYFDALSFESQTLWVKLIDEYYNNFEKYDEGKFINILSQEECDYFTLIMEELAKDSYKLNDDDYGYNYDDMCCCINKLQEIALQKRNEINKNKLNNSNESDSKKILTEIMNNKKRSLKLKQKNSKGRKN